MITKEGGARITVRWFSRGSLADRVRWRTQSGYRRVAWLGSAQPCTRGSGESSTRNRTRVPTSSRFPLPPRGRVHAPACKPALRVHRAADRNPTDVQHVYVSPGNINIAIYARFNWPAAPRPALGPRSPRPPPAGPLNTTANLPTRFDVQVHSPQEGRAPSRRPHGLSSPFVSETSFRRGMARYLYFRRYVRCSSFSACLALQTDLPIHRPK